MSQIVLFVDVSSRYSVVLAKKSGFNEIIALRQS